MFTSAKEVERSKKSRQNVDTNNEMLQNFNVDN